MCPTSWNVREAPANVEESIQAYEPIDDCLAAGCSLDWAVIARIEGEKSIIAHQKDPTFRYTSLRSRWLPWLPARGRTRVQRTAHVLHLTTLVYWLTRARMFYRHPGIAAGTFRGNEMGIHRNGTCIDNDVVAGFTKNPTDHNPLRSARFGANDEIAIVRGR